MEELKLVFEIFKGTSNRIEALSFSNGGLLIVILDEHKPITVASMILKIIGIFEGFGEVGSVSYTHLTLPTKRIV